jgi:hypothetical protein
MSGEFTPPSGAFVRLMAADAPLLERYYNGEIDGLRADLGDEDFEEFLKRVRLYENTMQSHVKNLEDLMKRDDVVVETIDVGDRVICDACGEEWTDRVDSGGILFQSKAICPDCSPQWEADAVKHNEEKFIRIRCPKGMSFAEWVRSIR